MPGLVSATGVLGFLADEEPELKVFALRTLNDDIDTVWTEVAGALSEMYALRPLTSVARDRLTDGLLHPARLSTKTTAFRSASSPPSSLPRSTSTCRPTMRA